MNFKEFLNESNREVSVEDRKIADDIENSLKKKLTQKFLDDILNKAIKDKVISKTSISLKKTGESNIKLSHLIVKPVVANMGLNGLISVDVEVSCLKNPNISIFSGERGFKSIESARRAVRGQVTNELIKVLMEQVSSQVKHITKVSKNSFYDSVFITLKYE